MSINALMQVNVEAPSECVCVCVPCVWHRGHLDYARNMRVTHCLGNISIILIKFCYCTNLQPKQRRF